MFKVNEDIRKASTLPSSFYHDKTTFYKATDKLLSSSWQLIGEDEEVIQVLQKGIQSRMIPEGSHLPVNKAYIITTA
jgi:hypothetical protein